MGEGSIQKSSDLDCSDPPESESVLKLEFCSRTIIEFTVNREWITTDRGFLDLLDRFWLWWTTSLSNRLGQFGEGTWVIHQWRLQWSVSRSAPGYLLTHSELSLCQNIHSVSFPQISPVPPSIHPHKSQLSSKPYHSHRNVICYQKMSCLVRQCET